MNHAGQASMNAAPGTTILIGLGSNVDAGRWVPRARRLLRDAFADVRVSTFYRTRPLGDPSHPPYVNGVIAATTPLAVVGVRATLRAIEYQCGRVRDPRDRWATRTLDLDLLAYGAAILEAEDLPAPELLERDFCLVPAAELLPDWVHPVAGRTLQQLAAERFPSCPNILAPVTFPIG